MVTKFKPAIFDDGLLQKQCADILKAFLNPTEEDCTIWARYGSATMDQGALAKSYIKRRAPRSQSDCLKGYVTCLSKCLMHVQHIGPTVMYMTVWIKLIYEWGPSLFDHEMIQHTSHGFRIYIYIYQNKYIYIYMIQDGNSGCIEISYALPQELHVNASITLTTKRLKSKLLRMLTKELKSKLLRMLDRRAAPCPTMSSCSS